MNPTRPLLACLLLAVTGCCGPKTEDYAGKMPQSDVRDFMNGDLNAFGIFYARGGDTDTRFTIRMHGDFSEREGTLAEDFAYTDGRTQHRVWHFRFSDDHHFTGTAADVIGVARGEQYGNAVHMQYTLQVPTKKGKTYDMDSDDWLYFTDENHLINRNTLSKYGFKAGELLISINKAE